MSCLLLINLSIIIMVFSMMYHYVFSFLFIPLNVLIIKRCGFKCLFLTILSCVLFSQFMIYPAVNHKNQIEGQVYMSDEKSVVIDDAQGKVKVYGNFINIDKGDQLCLSVSYYPQDKQDNNEGFSYQQYLKSIKVTKSARLVKIISQKKHHTLYQWLRQRCLSHHRQVSDYLEMLLFGIKDEGIKEIYQSFQTISIVHLFALSGMHLHILDQIITNILKYIFDQKKIKIISLILLGLYVYIIPFNISLLRAYFVMLFSFLFKGRLNKVEILSIVACGFIFFNPYVVFNISFLFSFSIYLFVLLIGDSRYSAFLIYLGSVPIILSLNYEIYLLSFLFAFGLTPFMTLFYPALIIVMVIGQVGDGMLMILIDILVKITSLSKALYFVIPFAKPHLFFIMSYYYFYAKIIIKDNMRQSFYKEMMLLFSLLVAFHYYPYYTLDNEVTMINVDQGDCFLIRQPMNKGNILIDTGGLRKRDVATEIIIPYLKAIGVYHLDYVLITHQDYDHCGALNSLKDHFPIQHVIEKYQDHLRVGDINIKMLKSPHVYDNENDNCLVFYMKINGLYYLFTGDISMQVEKDLYEKYHHLKVDVLKVSHHGSHSGNSLYLLEMTNPKIALISCGKNNMYGHPHKDVIDRLESYGVHIYRSDQTGFVKIKSFLGDNYIYQ